MKRVVAGDAGDAGDEQRERDGFVGAGDHASYCSRTNSECGVGRRNVSQSIHRVRMPHAAFGVAGDEGRIVGRRIDAGGGVVDDADQDRAAGLQHAELLELLGLFERRRRQRGDFEQRLAAIGVDAEVLEEDRWVVEAAERSARGSRTNGIGLRLKYSARPWLSNTTFTQAGLASCSGEAAAWRAWPCRPPGSVPTAR